MNIFALDFDTERCAQFHTDSHTIKMILEYSQLLSTAHRLLDGVHTYELSKAGRRVARWNIADERDVILYAATHVNHPSAVWARESSSNYKWLQNLLVMLCTEYTYRYGKIHKCQSIGLVDALQRIPTNIKHAEMTQIKLAMPDEYKVNDPIESYRNYYRYGKTHLQKWTGKIAGRPKPEWL